jgi:hypothetical protein
MSREQRINWGLIATLGLALLGWAFTGLRTYADDASTLKQRVSVIETKQDIGEKRLERIEEKLDALLQRTR